MCQQTKLVHTQWHGHIFKFGIRLPNDRNHALQIDKDNMKQLWELSIGVEMDQIGECDTFPDMGRDVKPPHDHQCIRVHFIFNVKHDLR